MSVATGCRFCDLHTHSTASDGSWSPAELVDAAARAKLVAVALTDHDTIAGLAAAAQQADHYPELIFVPGIEISARWPVGTLHILGLGVDAASPQLAELTDYLRACRDDRNPRMIARLQELGLDISMEDVRAQVPPRAAGEADIVSRVHIAEALQAKGYAKDRREAFDKYIGHGAAGYVEKERLSPSRAIAAILDAGGTAILAHPVQLKCVNHAQLERSLRELMDVGLSGIEVYHSSHSSEQMRLYLDLAKRYGLTVSGGSDYHGAGKPDVRLGRPRVPVSMIGEEQLRVWARED